MKRQLCFIFCIIIICTVLVACGIGSAVNAPSGITSLEESEQTVQSQASLQSKETGMEKIVTSVSVAASVTSNTVSRTREQSGQNKQSLDEKKKQLFKTIDKILGEITHKDMTLDQKMRTVYQYVGKGTKYRAVALDISKGFTQELIVDMALYFLKYRRGSCEHYAATVAMFFERLRLEARLVEGDRFSLIDKKWSDHVWVMAKAEQKYYHFDILFGRTYYNDWFVMYKKLDNDLESHHRWNRGEYPICDGKVTESSQSSSNIESTSRIENSSTANSSADTVTDIINSLLL